jgi:hypothetical protein
MYEPDAVEHALAYFRENPAAMMAYGHAEIIDAEKRVIGRYPTKPPSTPLTSFADGCFICQPTVFMRREAWQELGGLDASLQASFDFELWVRAFIAWPGRIGFLDRTQAYSRQHDATITHNKRRAVALEALQLLRKHLNITPANWILNHFEEVLVQCPTGEGKAPKDEIRSVLEEAAPLLYESELQKAQRWVNSDRRVALATSDVFVGVHTDGWAGPTLEIRTTSTKGRLNLHCSNLEPCPKKMKLRVTRVDGSQLLRKVSGRGNFLVEIDLVPSRCAAMPAFYTVTCDQHFVPITSPQQPADPRQLCYKINHIEHIT